MSSDSGMKSQSKKTSLSANATVFDDEITNKAVKTVAYVNFDKKE